MLYNNFCLSVYETELLGSHLALNTWIRKYSLKDKSMIELISCLEVNVFRRHVWK